MIDSNRLVIQILSTVSIRDLCDMSQTHMKNNVLCFLSQICYNIAREKNNEF